MNNRGSRPHGIPNRLAHLGSLVRCGHLHHKGSGLTSRHRGTLSRLAHLVSSVHRGPTYQRR